MDVVGPCSAVDVDPCVGRRHAHYPDRFRLISIIGVRSIRVIVVTVVAAGVFSNPDYLFTLSPNPNCVSLE